MKKLLYAALCVIITSGCNKSVSKPETSTTIPSVEGNFNNATSAPVRQDSATIELIKKKAAKVKYPKAKNK